MTLYLPCFAEGTARTATKLPFGKIHNGYFFKTWCFGHLKHANMRGVHGVFFFAFLKKDTEHQNFGAALGSAWIQ